jgi:site-specific recombinase XerD
LTTEFCQGFLSFLTKDYVSRHGKHIMATTANNILKYFRAVLHDAFDDGLIKENIGNKIELAKSDANPREFLSLEEVKMLASTPCEKPVLQRASLFSCLTGLRLSDVINLKWQNIEEASDGGLCMHIKVIKTGKEVFLPLSDDALRLCGERKDSGTVFEGLTRNMVNKYLKTWVKSAGITKYITFHCFRHTFATLQFAAGTDIYTISNLLTHSNITTTQVYTSVINAVKRDASNKIKLE